MRGNFGRIDTFARAGGILGTATLTGRKVYIYAGRVIGGFRDTTTVEAVTRLIGYRCWGTVAAKITVKRIIRRTVGRISRRNDGGKAHLLANACSYSIKNKYNAATPRNERYRLLAIEACPLKARTIFPGGHPDMFSH